LVKRNVIKEHPAIKKVYVMENARDVAVLPGYVGEANDLHINTTGLLPILLGVRSLFLNKKNLLNEYQKLLLKKIFRWVR
jgi:hypothetical protein